MPVVAPFSRRLAVTLLALVACLFASNHIAARIAFDHQAGVMLAVLCRSGFTLLLLAAIVLWQRQPLRIPAGAWPWQLAVGLLITVQGVLLYSAVARIPVALALLVANTYPILLALLTWLLGGAAPTRRVALLMALILAGLLLALDVPSRLQASGDDGLLLGAGLALCCACAFASALWITEHKLAGLPGSLRSMLTMAVVFASLILAGSSDLLPGGLQAPDATSGWLGLGALALLYGTGFTVLFICMPRLDMARNVTVMNLEPLATLLLGWAILDQALGPVQLLGATLVVSGIVLLTYRRP